ncbi:polyketide synthase PksN [Micromonospora pattaloongensis]|uniref:Polyketide synthase PksN n=1 Tax=Micromonospora pattaloongensis TaxID=405436 RepID=A0A1H3JU53_9ACTN|nr:amino acid adenylation domain-containing protein [Micromonospora pattaloongensis]SDY43472.1 polyketide synthase PksN [Micromonospora pattaloongensis]
MGAPSSLPARFAATRNLYPDRPAVVLGGQVLSYAQLDEAARALAAELVGRGVRRGELVGLQVTRSADLPVAILGIMMAGAAYLPLDPQLPIARLRLMAEEAEVRCLVGAMTDDLGSGIAHRVPVQGHPANPGFRPVDLEPGDRAYVIYTSGSTGRPKGCVITHGNVLSLLDAALPLFDVGPEDRWSLFHSINFDFSVWELWSPLITGGAVVVVNAMAALDLEEFVDVLAVERVSVLCQVPSVFRALARAHEGAGRPELALRYLIFGGEVVDLDVTAAFLDGLPGDRPVAVNMYGITETTVHVTFKELDRETLVGTVRSPIGRPLPHLDVTLRDEAGVEVAAGEIGEMWVSGSGVGAGYLRRDDLTAERFVAVGGVRHYRSGDLARRLPGGELDYAGRADRQVKVRGFRIELGEIESVLRQCTGVRDAVVDVRTGHDGHFLIGYVVADHDLDVRQIKAECGRLLSAHMIPSRYQRIAEIPVTASGKLDRAALAGAAYSHARGEAV